MKRTLTGIAAASMVLGMTIPAAFASTSSHSYNHREITVGSYSVSANGIAATDPWSGASTEFMPIWYLQQGLKAAGNTVTWDGTTQKLWITTANGSTSGLTAVTPGSKGVTIYINGVPVQNAPPALVANDPATKKATSFLPIYYLSQALKQLGYTQTYDGTAGTWDVTPASTTTTPPPVQTGTTSLGAVTATGENSGNGTAGNPAVSLNGGALTLSTTLTDANGNVVPNTQVTFNFSEYGQTLTGDYPTVKDASGNTVLGTNGSYQVYTDSNGVASINVAGPSGTTYAYQVAATAPYKNSNGTVVSSANFYAEFVANGQAGISPLASSGSGYNAVIGKAVPITVALPTDSNGVSASNELVQLTTTGGYFTNASGADLGQTTSVTTDASGVAQAWLVDNNADSNVKVTATPSNTSITAPPSTYFNFVQGGVTSQIANYVLSNNGASVGVGTNVTVSGTLQDAAGNPVPNGTVLVTGTSSSGDFGYVTGTTTTKFPNAYAGTGVPATSTYGDVVKADANGNFSFVVTDPKVESGTLKIYPVSNGAVSSNSALKATSVSFAVSNSLGQIAIGNTKTSLGNGNTSVTGLSVVNGGTQDIWAEPQNAAGSALPDQSFTYNVSASNGGVIKSINGVSLTNAVSALTVTETWDGTDYTISVPGQTVTTTAGSEDLQLTLGNSNTGDTKLTVSSGSYSATADVNFTGGTETQLANVSPLSGSMNPGGTEQISFTAEDVNGNPVANSVVPVAVADNTASNLWVTKVNGQVLQQTEPTATSGVAATYTTPIPLFDQTTSFNSTHLIGYSGVSVPGVVSASNIDTTGGTGVLPMMNVYTNAQGVATLTVQAGGVSYYTSGKTSDTAPLAAGGTNLNVGYAQAGAFTGLLAGAITGDTLPANSYDPTWSGVVTVSGAAASSDVAPKVESVTAGADQALTWTFYDNNGNAISNADVTFAKASGLASAEYSTTGATSSYSSTLPTGLKTNASGQVTIYLMDKTAESGTVSATADGAMVTSGTQTIVPATYAGLVVSGTSVSAVATPGTADTQTVTGVAAATPITLTVNAEDAFGNPVSNTDGITASVTSGGTRSTPSTVTASGTLSGGKITLTYTPGSTLGTPAADTITITDSTASFTDTITTNAF